MTMTNHQEHNMTDTTTEPGSANDATGDSSETPDTATPKSDTKATGAAEAKRYRERAQAAEAELETTKASLDAARLRIFAQFCRGEHRNVKHGERRVAATAMEDVLRELPMHEHFTDTGELDEERITASLQELHERAPHYFIADGGSRARGHGNLPTHTAARGNKLEAALKQKLPN